MLQCLGGRAGRRKIRRPLLPAGSRQLELKRLTVENFLNCHSGWFEQTEDREKRPDQTSAGARDLRTRPGFENKVRPAERILLSLFASLDDLRRKCFDNFGWVVGSGRMQARRDQERRNVEFSGLGKRIAWAGASGLSFDSIVGKIRVSFLSNCSERRQTKEASLKRATSHGSRARIRRNIFLIGIKQLPLKEFIGCGNKKSWQNARKRLGAKWQRWSPFAHPSSTVFFLRALQIQDAVSMAKPEV
jgi:hypothetical protein